MRTRHIEYLFDLWWYIADHLFLMIALIVSALVRDHLLRDIMSDNGSVFLIPGSLRRKMAAVYGSSNIPLYGEIKAS